MESLGRRRAIVAGLTLLGLGLSATVFQGLIAYPSTTRIEHHPLAYADPVTQQTWIAAACVAVTCRALAASRYPSFRRAALRILAGMPFGWRPSNTALVTSFAKL